MRHIWSHFLAVTVYVRKEEEKVYNALMLENLAIKDLKEAVSIRFVSSCHEELSNFNANLPSICVCHKHGYTYIICCVVSQFDLCPY